MKCVHENVGVDGVVTLGVSGAILT